MWVKISELGSAIGGHSDDKLGYGHSVTGSSRPERRQLVGISIGGQTEKGTVGRLLKHKCFKMTTYKNV